MPSKSNLLVTYNRRLLLRIKLGRSWRASLSQLATAKGFTLHPNSFSHIVAGDWRSSGLQIEKFIADILELPFDEVWPEYQLRKRSKLARAPVRRMAAHAS